MMIHIKDTTPIWKRGPLQFFLIATLIFSGGQIFSQSNKEEQIPNKVVGIEKMDVKESPTELNYSAAFFRERWLHYGFDAFIDNSLRSTVYQIETVGDISTPDRMAFSLHGSSYLWNKFYFDGIRINDPWQAGNSMYKPNLLHTGLSAGLNEFSIDFRPEDIEQAFVSVDLNTGGLGGVTGFTQPMIEWFHSTADDRLKIPINERRKIRTAVNAYFALPGNEKGSYLTGNISHGSRTFPDFSFEGLQSFYPEQYTNAFFHYRSTTDRGWFREKGVLLSYLNRDHHYAELYYGKDETSMFNAVNATIYGKTTKDNIQTIASLSLGYRGTKHVEPNFSRNILDQDGEGYEPWYPDSDDLLMSLQFDQEREMISGLQFFFKTYNSILQFEPGTKKPGNAIYMGNYDTVIPLYHVKWEARSFMAGLLENRAGFKFEKDIGNKLNLSMSTALSFDGFLLRGKSKLSPGYEGNLALEYSPFRNLALGIHFGKKNIPYNAEHLRFFSDDYLNGKWTYWNDESGDLAIQDNEAGPLYKYSGGLYHQMALDLEQGSYLYLDIPIEISWGKNKFFIYNYYKQFLNQWNIEYALGPGSIGHFTQKGGEDIFFLDEAPTYVAVPLSRSFIADQSGEASPLLSNPHFFGNTFGYSRVTDRLYLSVCWTSFQIQTFSALGHGLLHNSVGVLSESLANPNTRINSLGRADADRGFMARALVTYKINESFSTSFQFRWIDGQPFSKFLYYPESSGGYDQLAIVPYISKGNNPWPNGGGPREDGFFNNTLRVEYSNYLKDTRFGIVLSVYNMFDFRTNLSEYVFPEGNERYVLEYTVPRGAMIRLWAEI